MLKDERLTAAVERMPYEPLFVTISGAHLYGFASPDSDYDLRGSHLLPLSDVVGLRPPRETYEREEVRDGIEFDIVSHEARKFFALLLKSSGYALEQVASPLIVASSPAHEELRAIALANLNRRYARHYHGFATNQWRLFQKENPPRVKPLLYVFRVLLTGIHLLQRGELEADLNVLNERFRVPRVDELIAQKRATQEQTTLSDADMSFLEREFERLRALLIDAEANTHLPAENGAFDALDDLLRRLRLQSLSA